MLARFNGNVVPFADDATSTNRTVFGGTTQSDSIDDNLNADFKKGWEIVGLNDNPTREDFNAMGYTLGYLISYLYQNGVAEYNLLQEYKTNSIAIGADGNIYQSLVDNNIGNALTDTTKWKNVTSSFVDLVNNQSIDGIKTFVKSPIVPTPTTNTQAANKSYVDSKAAEIATAVEIRTGTNNTKAISPLGYNQTTLGWGQTWQDVKASRASGVTYTNTTGRPIQVTVLNSGAIAGTTTTASLYVDSLMVSVFVTTNTSAAIPCSAIIPNGSTYNYTTNVSINQWFELR